MSNDEEALWHKWSSSKCQFARNALFDMHKNWSELESVVLSKKLRIAGVDVSDYISFGHEGLLLAISNFDPYAGYLFKTYAQYRVKGNILNQVFKYSDQSYAYSKLNGVTNVPNEQKEPLTVVSSEDELVSLIETFSTQYLIEFENDKSENGQGLFHGYFSSPEMHCLKEQCKNKIQLLPQKQKEVLTLHYFDFIEFKGISNLLNLSVSRVSQLHKDALENLTLYIERGS
ncbi:sigma-70 family RNA polymerase sigma factor [Pseudoalteromonas aurantia]|uniref:RNA polymerase sigma-70 region 4 domain-containing protein n=1 Tax=Pseudoalteromonas aurantia TaxID=43654 RepID=A0A5S3V6C1_9GAMM|nr:sigma-70 family RNA polymerase sigma factor [Pseudoalteromonas aurantia]TMO66639.1 hypothetical protein CWC19_15865 [Pseudoalteromonas aurantia]